MDLDWVKEFDKTDKIFSPFYCKKVDTINLFLLYVEKDENSIFHMKKEKISLHRKILSLEQIIKILELKGIFPIDRFCRENKLKRF